MAVNTTSTLSNEMMAYLSEEFLTRQEQANIHGQGAKEVTHSANSGKTVTWNRYVPRAAATTALTEGANPSEVNTTSATVTATIAEYGSWDKISSLLYGTSIDRAAKEKVEVLAQQAVETIDTLVRNELAAGATTQFANGRAALVNVAAGDNMTSTEVRKAVRGLRKNDAMTYEDGSFLGKIGPDTEFDIMADSVWVASHTYKDGKELYAGEIGRLFGVRFLSCSSNQFFDDGAGAAGIDVYSNFIHGKEAIGTVKLNGANDRVIFKQPTNSDTSNPLDMFMTIGWKRTFATKTLNSDWIVNVKSAASA